MILKRASKKDCDLLFNWINDEEVRKNSFSTERILYEDHIKWFNEKIKSDKSIIYLLECNDIPIGQVRIDVDDKVGIISYSLDKDYRRKGFSVVMMSLLEEEIRKSSININKLNGFVKFENIASQKVFENLKYNKIFHNEFLEYQKDLNN